MNINILIQSVSNAIFRFEMEAELNLEIMMSSMECFLPTSTCTTSKITKRLRKVCHIRRHCADIVSDVKYDSRINGLSHYLYMHTHGHSFIVNRAPA